jgi:DNA-binding Lrp family transcriptional regulator
VSKKRVKIDNNLLVKFYNEKMTNCDIAEYFKCSETSIERRIRRLKKEGLIKNKKIVPIERRLDIDRAELIKLLALYKSQSRVAKKLGVHQSTINKLCTEYRILDSKTLSVLLNESLSNLTKNYKKEFEDKYNSHGGDETLVIGLSDWHVGKVVINANKNILYDENVFKYRIEKLITAMLKLVDSHITKHVKLKEVYVLSCGDMANGEDIYPTQAYQQEFSPPVQVMTVVEYFTKLIDALLDRGLVVHFRGVKGNHGRLGKDSDPASNWDLMIYMIMQHVQKIRNIKNLDIQFSNSDYYTFKIRKWNYLIRHQAYVQDETAAGRAKYLGWEKMHNADLVVSGHYHHLDLNERRIVVGSPVGFDDLSERMATPEGEPSQLIWLCTDERKWTNAYPVDLKSR